MEAEARLEYNHKQWLDTQATRIFFQLLNERRENVLREIKHAARKGENVIGPAMRLHELDDITEWLKDGKRFAEYARRNLNSRPFNGVAV